jgi:hypothetical protein
VAFKFELISTDGKILDSIKTNEANWQVGDTITGHGNTRYTVVSVIPLARVEEFIESDGDGRSGVLEVVPA